MSKTLLFQTIQFNISTHFSSIQLIDKTPQKKKSRVIDEKERLYNILRFFCFR